MSSVNKDYFTSSFPVWLSLISLSCLIALASTSHTVLNRSGERGHLCLVLDLRGKAFCLSLLSVMITMFFS